MQTLEHCLQSLDGLPAQVRPAEPVQWLIGSSLILPVEKALDLVRQAGIAEQEAEVHLDRCGFPQAIYGAAPDGVLWTLFSVWLQKQETALQVEQCYPCSVQGYRCVLHEAWRPKVQRKRRRYAAVLPCATTERVCPWFDVALWRHKDQKSFPEYTGYVEAASPFSAVERMMHYYQVQCVPVASVRSLDGVQVYRAFGVWVCLSEK